MLQLVIDILLMVQKSGVHQLRLIVYAIIYKVLYIPSGDNQLRLVVYAIIYKVLYIPSGWEWDFWTINSSTPQSWTKPPLKASKDHFSGASCWTSGV